MKKILSILLCVVICSASMVSAFADDEEIAGGDESSPVYNANFEEMKAKTIENAKQTSDLVGKTILAVTGDGTKATDYAQSIYNGFFSSSSGVFGGSSSSWGSITVTRLGTINSSCTTIKNTCNSILTNLQSIQDMINHDYSTSGSPLEGLSIVDVLGTFEMNLLNELTYVDAEDDILSIAELLLVIDNNIDSTRSAILQYLSLMNSNISTIQNYTLNIKNNVDDIETNTYSAKNSLLTLVSNIQKLVDLYGTDDYEDAKEEQAPLEAQVIEDFTGNGSASASVGNAIDAKNISGQLQGSLNTGASASGLSSILNTNNSSSNDSYFRFFSQDVYNDLNGVNNINRTRDVYINVLDYNNQQLQEMFRGSTW